MANNKENENEIKKIERQIKSWEAEKSYPTLENIYQMAYIINVNPGELLAIRNRGRKQFYRESNDPPKKRHDWIEISDNASVIFSGVSRLFGIFALVAFIIVFYKFQDTYFGGTATQVELEVIDRQIRNGTGQNVINDGTVANMLKRKRKESEKNTNSLIGESENPSSSVNYKLEDPREEADWFLYFFPNTNSNLTENNILEN